MGETLFDAVFSEVPEVIVEEADSVDVTGVGDETGVSIGAEEGAGSVDAEVVDGGAVVSACSTELQPVISDSKVKASTAAKCDDFSMNF